MKKYISLLFLFLMAACVGKKNPEFVKLDNINSKTTRNNISINGMARFVNNTKADIYLIEMAGDVMLDGKNVSSLISRSTALISMDSNFSIPFSCNLPSSSVFTEGGTGEKNMTLHIKGNLKSRSGDKILTTPVDAKEMITLKGWKRNKDKDEEGSRSDKKQKNKSGN